MTLDADALVLFGRIADTGSGILFLILGALTLGVRPRRRVNVAFALFALCFGAAYSLANFPGIRDTPFEGLSLIAFSIPATLALMVVAHEFPQPLGEAQRGWQARTQLVAAVAVLLLLAGDPFVATQGLSGLMSGLWRFSYALLFGMGFAAFLVLLALRYGSADDRARGLVLLATVAFLPFFAIATGLYGTMYAAELRTGDRAYFPTVTWTMVPMLVLVLAAWIRNTRRGPTAARRRARDVAIAGAGLAAIGAAFAALFGAENQPNNLGLLGLSRAFGVSVLAYAILRHQMLGIDVKVRFAIKGSTLAAIFVGVFFVVSEAAQQFFSDRTNSAYYGIAAAGALVFAIAPLQRLAERVANKAVPAATPDDRIAMYRRQLELAWRDGTIGRAESLMLDALRTDLGLDEETARRVEREMASGTAS